jgi:hypothetical protein
MRLIDLVSQGGFTSVAVMGLAKNAGKTVALNQLIEESMDLGITLGLTSTGRDGEKMDIVTETEKPAIFAPRGPLLATAEGTLRSADAKVEVLRTTPFSTPMGDVVIGRVREAGHVEIAGADTNAQIRQTMEMMTEFGARLVLVDGAIDRIAAAAPTVTEATVLATGAAVNRDMAKVIEKTAHIVELFKSEVPADPEILAAAKGIVEERKVALIDRNYTVHNLNLRTALEAGREIAAAIKEDTAAVVLGGSLVTSVLTDIMNSVRDYENWELIVGDGTRVFVEPRVWRMFVRRGGKLRVVFPINLLAVTVNSYSPQGWHFDAVELLERMGRTLHPLPVFDLFLNQGENTGGVWGIG